jgi:proton-coupled amino acid transporter
MVLFLPLVWLRKTEKLAFTHIFADIMVLVGLITITIYATQEINTNGIKPLTFITSGFSSAISYAVFAFEGVGVVLPILELTENKENYFTLLSVTLVFICIIFVAFCEYAAFAYGLPEFNTDGI